MKQFLFGSFGAIVLALGLGVLATPVKASGGTCAGGYSVTATATGTTYNQAYSNLVADLQAQASNQNGFCRVYGTCDEVFTVTRSDYQEDLRIWLLQGREDFKCIFVF